VNSPITGFLDVKADKQVNVLYPNPASEKLNLNYTLKTLANVSVKLISLTGQTIYTIT